MARGVGFFSAGRVIPSAERHRPRGAPVGCFAGVLFALVGGPAGLRPVLLPVGIARPRADGDGFSPEWTVKRPVGRRPRRAVPACCRANSSFRVPSGPARHALGAIQLFRTWRNRMNRPGARPTTVGRSSFSGRAPENWAASRKSALRRSARAAATPGGARNSSALVAFPAGVGPPFLTCQASKPPNHPTGAFYSWRQRNGRPSARPLLPCGWSQL